MVLTSSTVAVLAPSPLPTRNPPAGWCPTRLAAGDTLALLAAEYLPNTEPQAAARTIVEVNGVSFNVQAINAWVINGGGRWLPYVSGERVPGSPTGGWAVFTDRNTILLPCDRPHDDDGEHVDDDANGKKGFPWWLLILGVGTAAAGYAMTRNDDKKKGGR